MKRLVTVAIATVVALILLSRRDGAPSLASGIGWLLRKVRSGDAQLAANDPALRDLPRFELTSDAFADGNPLPAPYTGVHGIQPALKWDGEPADTLELAFIVEDIDVPFPAPLVHAVAHGVDPARRTLAAGAIPAPGSNAPRDPAVALGRGSGGPVFLPPTPIPGHGPHRYVFQAFALRRRLKFEHPPNKAELLAALRAGAVACATLTGTHENP